MLIISTSFLGWAEGEEGKEGVGEGKGGKEACVDRPPHPCAPLTQAPGVGGGGVGLTRHPSPHGAELARGAPFPFPITISQEHFSRLGKLGRATKEPKK